jgi:hypothetical protein
MKTILAILLTIQLSASDQIPYKDYCGECYTIVVIDGDTFAVDGTWKPIPEYEFKDIDIKPSTTVYREPEKFIPKYHTPFTEVKQGTDWNKVVEWLFNVPVLVFASLFWVYRKTVLRF